MMYLNKLGIASWITQMLIALFAIGSVAFLYFLLYGRYIDVHAIVISAEAQRHTIGIAQVILSSDKLVYEEDFGGTPPIKRFHRGVFDRQKLDEQLVSEEYFDTFSTVTRDSDVTREIGYPNTAINIIVYDIDNNDKWVLSYSGPQLEGHNELQDCMNTNFGGNPFFMLVPDIPFVKLGLQALWGFWDVTECYATYVSKLGVFEKDFPALIRDDDSIHTARLSIKVMEI